MIKGRDTEMSHSILKARRQKELVRTETMRLGGHRFLGDSKDLLLSLFLYFFLTYFPGTEVRERPDCFHCKRRILLPGNPNGSAPK